MAEGGFESRAALLISEAALGINPIREADMTGEPRAGRVGPCVDGSRLARDFLHACSIGRSSHVFGLSVRFT
jgi:hypothetical protein